MIADSMFGEVTPKMAAAVGQSAAKRLLIPINQCSNIILGVHNLSINDITTDILNDLQS